MINELMQKQNISKYRLSKSSGIPYATINDICNGKAQLKRCSAETVFKISQQLHVSMEELLKPFMLERASFELFKSNVCHRLKNIGDLNYIKELLEQDEITEYYNRKWYPECLYLLAMLDYLSNQNHIPLYDKYDYLRKQRLETTSYPKSIITLCEVTGYDEYKQQALNEAIPEFLRYNIVESEVRDVI